MGEPIPAFQLLAAQRLAARPEPGVLFGKFVSLTPYEEQSHGAALHAAVNGDAYLGHPSYDANELIHKFLLTPTLDPPPSSGHASSFDLARSIAQNRIRNAAPDRRLFVIQTLADGAVVGHIGLLNARPADLVIEIGHVAMTPAIQGTPVASESTFLLLRYLFDAGWRRVEWKANALNERSRKCALRLGFTYEGIFRSHMISSDLNYAVFSRDTWWAAMLYTEWPAARDAFLAWIDEGGGALYERRRLQLRELTRQQQ